MPRYYAWFQTSEDAHIAAKMALWKNQFAKFSNRIGFFDLENSGGKLDSEIILELIISKNESLRDINEILILPIYNEPNDMPGLFRSISSLQDDLRQHINREAIQNIFVFPVIRIQSAASGSLSAPCFLFLTKRLTLEHYRVPDWLADIESFMHLNLEIEDQGLRLFDYFPLHHPYEIATFTSQTVFLQKYMEMKKFLSMNLKKWIETQIIAEADCIPFLPDHKSELDKINHIGTKVSQEDLNREALSLESGGFTYLTGLSFTRLKNNFKEFKTTNLTAKIREAARDRQDDIDKETVKWELENRIAETTSLTETGLFDYLEKGKEGLVRRQTTVNCLMKDIEKLQSVKADPLPSINQSFEKWTAKEIVDAGTERIFRNILDKMDIYLKGVSKAVLLLTYIAGFPLVFYLIREIADILPLNLSLKWLLLISALLPLFFPWIYNRIWHARKKKDLENRIQSFTKSLKRALTSAVRGYVQNAVNFYFQRYAKRREISLRRELHRLAAYLETVKTSLADYKTVNLTMEIHPPPSEFSQMINQMKWEAVFTELEGWDSFTLKYHFDTIIEDTATRLMKEHDPDRRFPVDKDFQVILRKRFTIQIPEPAIKSKILLPETAQRQSLGDVEPGLILEYPFENKAIIIGTGKIASSSLNMNNAGK